MSSLSGLPSPDGLGSEWSSHDAGHGFSRRAFIGGAAVATWASLDRGGMRPAAASTRTRTRTSTPTISPFRIRVPWVQQVYPTLTYYNEADAGGHFAAWEEPELFATEIRAAFRSLR